MKMEKIQVSCRAFFLPLSFIPKAVRSQGLVPVDFPFDWLSLVAIRGAGAASGAESVGKLCRPRLGAVEGMPVPPGFVLLDLCSVDILFTITTYFLPYLSLYRAVFFSLGTLGSQQFPNCSHSGS